MTITKTKEAIDFYQLAIENAKTVLKNKIDNDKEFKEFGKKYSGLKNISTIFHPTTLDFSFFSWDFDKEHVTEFFMITNNEISYDENNTFEGIEDIAKELLTIANRF